MDVDYAAAFAADDMGFKGDDALKIAGRILRDRDYYRRYRAVTLDREIRSVLDLHHGFDPPDPNSRDERIRDIVRADIETHQDSR